MIVFPYADTKKNIFIDRSSLSQVIMLLVDRPLRVHDLEIKNLGMGFFLSALTVKIY